MESDSLETESGLVENRRNLLSLENGWPGLRRVRLLGLLFFDILFIRVILSTPITHRFHTAPWPADCRGCHARKSKQTNRRPNASSRPSCVLDGHEYNACHDGPIRMEQMRRPSMSSIDDAESSPPNPYQAGQGDYEGSTVFHSDDVQLSLRDIMWADIGVSSGIISYPLLRPSWHPTTSLLRNQPKRPRQRRNQ